MQEKDLYRIGTVASLTGISVERLRAWERRYDLSPAHKSGRTRFYSKQQLERLRLIKHLIDQGQPISTLADLDHQQLLDRLEDEQGPQLEVTHQIRVGLVGPNLIMLEQQAAQAGKTRSRLEVISRWANMEAFCNEQTNTDSPQLLILQLPVLAQQDIDIAKEFFPEASILVVYQFTTEKILEHLERSGLTALKWPLSWSEIEHVAIATVGHDSTQTRHAARRFSDEELIAIASSELDPSACAQHLVEVINQLNAFITYSDDCALSLPGAERYRQLSKDTSHARAQLEQALASLADSAGTAQEHVETHPPIQKLYKN